MLAPLGIGPSRCITLVESIPPSNVHPSLTVLRFQHFNLKVYYHCQFQSARRQVKYVKVVSFEAIVGGERIVMPPQPAECSDGSLTLASAKGSNSFETTKLPSLKR